MFSPIEEIKSRLDVVDLVQSYVKLQKSGINYKANCPFHSEKTPSFYVTPARQIWHCFGCGKGGDIFKFIMEIEGHDFPEALRLLATRAGVTITREDPLIHSERNRLYDLSEEAVKIFERNLSLTSAVKNYLKKRGLQDETISEFRIGFAPSSWDHLIKSLVAKGFRKEEIEKAGLAIHSQDNASWYDRFRSRIMFPIMDAAGRIIGFGGRIFEQIGQSTDSSKIEAKYVNTPLTLIYDKSHVLYGFEKAKQEIRTKDEVVIVEGYMDCMMSHQAGVKNTVAISGTALTPFQLKMLRRLAGTIISSFDTDQAGDSATKRSLALATQFDFVRKIAVIPFGKDPADTVLENPSLWVKAVAEAKDVVSFYFEKALRDYRLETVDGKKAIAALVLPFVYELSDEIEKAHWVGELSRRLLLPEEAIWTELKKKRDNLDAVYQSPVEEKAAPPSRRERLEEQFLSLLAIIDRYEKIQECSFQNIVFASNLHTRIFQYLTKAAKFELTPAENNALQTFAFKGEVLKNTSENDTYTEFLRSKQELEKIYIKEKLMAVEKEIQSLEKQGGSETLEPLLKIFRELSQSLNNIA